MISDEILTERMAQGDQEAFEIVVTRYHGPLLSFLTGHLHDRYKAEDFVQETFLRLIRHLRKHGELAQLRPWLYKVALNLCRDFWRTSLFRNEQLAPENMPESVDLSPDAQAIMEQEVLNAQLVSILQTLPDIQRQIVSLRFFHELKLHEIAEIEELPLSLVKSHLYGALRKLKRILDSQQENPEKEARRYEDIF